MLAGIESVLKLLHRLAGREWASPDGSRPGLGFAEGNTLLHANTDALLGPAPRKRSVRIMVTVPLEAAEDYELVRQLVAKGMNCMRINCAHDNIEAWNAMIAKLQRAKQELGKECRIEMDLAGPRPGDLGDASVGEPRKDRCAVTRRNHRRGDGRTGGMRDVEQRAASGARGAGVG